MSLPLDFLFNQVSQAIQSHASPDTPGPSYNANPLLGAIQGAFSNFAGQGGGQFNPQQGYDHGQQFQQQYGNVQSASQDPYGDPADQGAAQYGNVLPASADPYGDPANQGR